MVHPLRFKPLVIRFGSQKIATARFLIQDWDPTATWHHRQIGTYLLSSSRKAKDEKIGVKNVW